MTVTAKCFLKRRLYIIIPRKIHKLIGVTQVDLRVHEGVNYKVRFGGVAAAVPSAAKPYRMRLPGPYLRMISWQVRLQMGYCILPHQIRSAKSFRGTQDRGTRNPRIPCENEILLAHRHGGHQRGISYLSIAISARWVNARILCTVMLAPYRGSSFR